MGGAFDPYYRWLGIPPKDQPPNFYRLLGVELFESDADVIDEAAARQLAHVRTHQTGRHADLSQRLLNEISAARRRLLDTTTKRDYDARLRAQEETEAAPLAVRPLPEAVPLHPPPTAKPAVTAIEPAVTFTDRGAGSVARRAARKRNSGSQLPLLLLAGGGALALLIVVGALAWSAFFLPADRTTASTGGPAAGNTSSRRAASSSGGPAHRSNRRDDDFALRPAADGAAPSQSVEWEGWDRTEGVAGDDAFPTVREDPVDLHPVPRGEFASIDDLPPEKADPIVARVNPATISVQLPDGRSTTAFLVDRRGWAITNYRFVAGARSATAVYGPRAQTPVQGVVAANPRCDLVLLCVGLVDEEPAIAMLAAAPYETPEIVLCGSTPTPDRFTVSIAQTLAPISGVEARELMNSEERADLFAQRGYGSQTLWVRTTVNIQEGRLGAPIIDTQSRVVGVATWSSPRDRTVSCAVSVVEIHELLRRAGDKIYPLSALDGKTLLPK